MQLLRSFICISPVGMKPMHNISIKEQLRAFLCLGLRSNPLLTTSGVYLKPSARKMQNMIGRQNQGRLKLLRVLTLGKFSKTASSLKRSLRHTQRHTRLKILYVRHISTINNFPWEFVVSNNLVVPLQPKSEAGNGQISYPALLFVLGTLVLKHIKYVEFV